MNTYRAPLSAAALAGGQSRRMGSDKALLPLVAGGQPMLGVVLERLGAVADDVVVVANDQARYAALGARVVPDLRRDVGTLGGIQAAIAWSAHDHCLVVACDMPFLSLALLRRMADEPRNYDVLVPLIPGESRQRDDGLVFQTLHAIYSKRCLPFIEKQIAEGKNRSLASLRTCGFARSTSRTSRFGIPTCGRSSMSILPEGLRIAAKVNALPEPDSDI